MFHVGNVLLLLVALPAWIVVVWYGLRMRHLILSDQSWNQWLMAWVVGLLATEELVMQRLNGGWTYHDAFIPLVVAITSVLMWQRVFFLVETRLDRTEENEDARR